MNDLIQALKKNEEPFGLMSEEMQAKAREINKGFEVCLQGGWAECGITGDFSAEMAYRLRADYAEEPEVEKVGLEMKYFILKPKGKHVCDVYAEASQSAMLAYAETIEAENPVLARELNQWAQREVTAQARRKSKCSNQQ